MSDRFCGLYVTLKKDVSKENIENISTLISYIIGVVSVTPKIADIGHQIAYERAKSEIIQDILKTIKDKNL
jgi:hypothetical protein